MVREIALTALGAASVFFLAGSGGAQKASPPSGKALYEKFGCYACHGHAGAGGMTAGPPLAGRGFDADYVIAYSRTPKGVMPPYRSSMVTDAQMAAIARYVVNMPGAKPYTQVPKLARLAPKAVAAAPAAAHPSPASQYEAHCASCHGANGQGTTAPALLDEASKRTVEQTIALLRKPPMGMPQLSPDPIPLEDLPALAEHTRGMDKR